MKSFILITFQLIILQIGDGAFGLRIRNSCGSAVCEAGMRCVLTSVQCFTTPCDPVPQCQRYIDSSPLGADGAKSCKKMRCGEGYVCAMHKVDQRLCKGAPCRPTPRCVPAPVRKGCYNTVCGKGEVCVMNQVQCIRAPCPALPQCAPAPSPITCANVRCAGGPCHMKRDCPTCPMKPRCKPTPVTLDTSIHNSNS